MGALIVTPSSSSYPWTPVNPAQKNVSIAVATPLTVPPGASMAIVTAVGGAAYYTFDGAAPTSSSFAGYLPSAGAAVEFVGSATLSAVQIIGTQISVAYFN